MDGKSSILDFSTLEEKFPFHLKKEWPILVLGSFFLIWIISHYGMIQFGGMDGSALINAGWRYYLGQEPYRDFISVAPPAYILGAGFAFDLWGCSWRSLVKLTAYFSAITFIVQYLQFRALKIAISWSALFTLVVQCMTLVEISWWHYNHTTSISSVLYVTACLLLLNSPEKLWVRIQFIVSCVLLSMMKPSSAAPLLILTSLPFIFSQKSLKTYLSCVIQAAGLSVLFLVLSGVNPLLMIEAYLSASGRASLDHLTRYFLNTNTSEFSFSCIGFIGIAVCLGNLARVLIISKKSQLINRSILYYSFLSILVGLLGFATNNEHRIVDVPLILLGEFLLLRETLRVAPDLFSKIRYQLWSALLLFYWGAIGVYVCTERLRILDIGPNRFYEDVPLQKITEPPFFEGMEVSPRFAELLDELQQVLLQIPSSTFQSGELFFGPRIEFAYAAYKIYPAKNLPLWWMGTGESTPKMDAQIFNHFIKASFKFCFFMSTKQNWLLLDFTYMNEEILNYLMSNYTYQVFPSLTLFTPRSTLSVPKSKDTTSAGFVPGTH